MSKALARAMDAVRRTLDTEGAPARMSKAEYLEFLEEVSAELEGRIDAVKSELKEEG